MSFATIDALRESLARPTQKIRTPEYIAKMLHPVPKATVVDRHAFILERCTDKCVLEFGASGPLHFKIRQAARDYYGIDRKDSDQVLAFDLDDVKAADLPAGGAERPDIIICGEILEHLANPGHFLRRLKTHFGGIETIITVPNAFCAASNAQIEDGQENVNIDHVSWYSYRTLKTLLDRYGYAIEAFHWYLGEPLTAEGLIVVTR